MGIRVLHVIDRLKMVSGIARAVLNYYELIDTNEVQFDFLTVDPDREIVDYVHSRGGEVYVIEKLGATNIRLVRNQINEFFSQNAKRYTAVHSSFYHIDFLIFPAAKRYGIRHCISHSHNTRYADYKIRAIRNKVMSLGSCIYATEYAACSMDAAVALFGQKAIDRKGVFIMNNAIHTSNYRYDPLAREKMRAELGVQGRYVIGHVGRFNPQKNHAFLFQIFEQYAQMDENAVLLLVGEGELKASYEELARQKHLEDKVIFLGARADVPQLLQAMDCYVFPSLYEGLGISLVQAEAAGLPCAASDQVPKESKVTEQVVYLPLNNTDAWVGFIRCSKDYVRKDETNSLIQSGYDLQTAVKSLEKYYQALN